MTIGFILNGEDVVINCDADVRLIDVLRGNFGLLGAKVGCRTGRCGMCSVIINGAVIQACLIPAFKIRDSEIITIEGFSQTNDYQDIITGFAQARLETCGYCRTGKILCAAALLGNNERPNREEILAGFSGIKCRCTESDVLVEALTASSQIRMRRLYGRAS
ncbi:MAG TPA: aldehyde oxidoreductase [Treponema sp.]|nr:aldehyde oxidoreductase [Treponema sp.]